MEHGGFYDRFLTCKKHFHRHAGIQIQELRALINSRDQTRPEKIKKHSKEEKLKKVRCPIEQK